jgi:hypothetical protein
MKKNRTRKIIKKGGHLMLFEHGTTVKNRKQPSISFTVQWHVPSRSQNTPKTIADSYIVNGTTHMFKHLDTFKEWREFSFNSETMAQIYEDYNDSGNSVDVGALKNITDFTSHILQNIMRLEIDDDLVNNKNQAYGYHAGMYEYTKNHVRIIYEGARIDSGQCKFRLISIYRIINGSPAYGTKGPGGKNENGECEVYPKSFSGTSALGGGARGTQSVCPFLDDSSFPSLGQASSSKAATPNSTKEVEKHKKRLAKEAAKAAKQLDEASLKKEKAAKTADEVKLKIQATEELLKDLQQLLVEAEQKSEAANVEYEEAVKKSEKTNSLYEDTKSHSEEGRNKTEKV